MKTIMSNITACPLDCFDACEIVYENDKITAKKDGHTDGFLCPHLNHYEKCKHIIKPSYNGVEISLDEALDKLKEIIKEGKAEGANKYAEKFDWYKSNQKKIIKDWDLPEYNW